MRYNGKGYMKLLKRRMSLKRSGKMSEWKRLEKKASVYRKRMIGNPGHTVQRKLPKKCAMDAKSKELLARTLRTADGKAVAKRFRQFWKIPCPPSVKLIPGGDPKSTVPLVGMGHTKEVFLSDGQKGQKGKKQRVIRGNWQVATERTGRHVLLLSKRPMSGALKFVGFAPQTIYIPPADVEKAGTHKAGFIWKHVHGQPDGKSIPRNELNWPKVYADRDGKVDGSSNFVYGSTKHAKITDWMYG